MQFEKGVGGALAVAVITGIALWSAPSFTQTNPDPNAAPNPYRLDEGWAKLPAGRKAMFGASGEACASSCFQQREVRQILTPLFQPTIVVRLILGADEAVGPPATIGRGVNIAPRISNGPLDMATGTLGSPEYPRFARRIGKETAEFHAVRAPARKGARPAPISWRFQGLCVPASQIIDAGGSQSLYRRRVPGRRPDQLANSRDQDSVEAISTRQSQDMVCGAVRQNRVDASDGGEEIDEKSGLHTRQAAPLMGRRGMGWIARQGFDQDGGGGAELGQPATGLRLAGREFSGAGQ